MLYVDHLVSISLENLIRPLQFSANFIKSRHPSNPTHRSSSVNSSIHSHQLVRWGLYWCWITERNPERVSLASDFEGRCSHADRVKICQRSNFGISFHIIFFFEKISLYIRRVIVSVIAICWLWAVCENSICQSDNSSIFLSIPLSENSSFLIHYEIFSGESVSLA